MGPLAAIPRIPKLLAIMWRTAFHLVATKPDLVVLVDFGVFNLRLAMTLRRLGYAGPVLDVFPPGTWLDNPKKARTVAAVAVPMTAFAHQASFYESLGLPVVYFGHPLVGRYRRRPVPRSAARRRRHRCDASGQPQRRVALPLAGPCDGVCAAAAAPPAACAACSVRPTIAPRYASSKRFDGTVSPRSKSRAARLRRLREADAAWVASGTAVLETVLCGVPAVAFYIITPMLVKHGRTMIKHDFITLPNLVLQREVVPELLQEASDAGADGRCDGRGASRSRPAVRAVRGTATGSRAPRCAGTLRAFRLRAGAVAWRRDRFAGVIRIYHTSDLHDRRGIVPPLRALREAQPGLLFDCGDSLRGSQTVYHRDEPILAEIDAAGYDAQAIGNREFHYLFPLLRARARTHAPPARLHESRRYEEPAVALRAFADDRTRRRPHSRTRAPRHAVSGGQCVGAHFRMAFSRPVGRDRTIRARGARRRRAGRALARRLASRPEAGAGSSRASICCSAATATTRSSNRSTPATFRSFTPDPTDATFRRANLSTTRRARASSLAVSGSFRFCRQHDGGSVRQ